jgi:hypothetical protein
MRKMGRNMLNGDKRRIFMKRKIVAILAFSVVLMMRPSTVYATESLSAETWLIDIDELQEEQQDNEQQNNEQQVENENVLYGNAQPNPVFLVEGYNEMPGPLLTLSGSAGDTKAPKTDEVYPYAEAIAVVSGVLAAITIAKSSKRVKV